MKSAEKKSKSNGSSPGKSSSNRYVVCVKNRDYPASLELRKIYKVVPDKPAAGHGLLRILDESGDDYLYPADHFVSIKLTRTVERAVQLAS
jgi:hypothetical protein